MLFVPFLGKEKKKAEYRLPRYRKAHRFKSIFGAFCFVGLFLIYFPVFGARLTSSRPENQLEVSRPFSKTEGKTEGKPYLRVWRPSAKEIRSGLFCI